MFSQLRDREHANLEQLLIELENLKRKETCESEAIPSSDCIEFLHSDEEETDCSKEVVANVNILL